MMPHQLSTLGVRRTVERGKRASYVRIEELVCPCCGCLTRVEWEQERFNKPPIIETHCENRACTAWSVTLDVDSFFDRFGRSALQSDE